MSRWIDAEWLLNKYKGYHDLYLNAWDGDFKAMDAKDKARCDELNACIAGLFNAPSIDICFCRECMHWNKAPNTERGWCDKCDGLLEPNFYCADGEREGE